MGVIGEVNFMRVNTAMTPDGEANAALIVEAVNSHAALKAENEELRRVLEEVWKSTRKEPSDNPGKWCWYIPDSAYLKLKEAAVPRDRSSRPVAQASPAKCEAVGMGSTPTIPTSANETCPACIATMCSHVRASLGAFEMLDKAHRSDAEAKKKLVDLCNSTMDAMEKRIAELEGALREAADAICSEFCTSKSHRPPCLEARAAIGGGK
jgi:hypothetical protein